MTIAVFGRENSITLANGCRVRIRALRPGEDGTIRELFARLSLPTRHLRFFQPLPALPESLLRLLGSVEDPWRIAFVAESDDASADVVALGNVCPSDEGRGEVGLVVADGWQRQGIGRVLADRLLQVAYARGYRQFVVHSLAANPAVAPLLRHVAEIMSTTTRHGVSEIVFVRRRGAELSGRRSRTAADEALEQAYERLLTNFHRSRGC